ncbi:leucyl aminopeptidase [Mameliella alba]|uniref:leucyl aminopeptidase n=1 Tax=Mameliella alba TaxID=561184 RepID=UPI00088E2852|nr:leucyl aminopeptidase [Mameliella alba]OWV49628.1 leucyl aminopeptidase [Mameliella alba]PTR41608.1 leucyl aminopeptidase [Mameliella alba]GGF52963.1 putative cytosol aminopeptidase [Mameliella alba]SDC36582.1 leucyl aminopeptidase [Mameliella alba]
MTDLRAISFAEVALDGLEQAEGRLAVLVTPEGTLSPGARRLNRLTKGALGRAVESEAWGKLSAGEALSLAWPAGLSAEGVEIVKLARRPSVAEARKAGATMARAAGKSALTVLVEVTRLPEEIALGLALRGYAFTARKSEPAEVPAAAVIMVKAPEEAEAAHAAARAVAEGIAFTRDLVSEPANVLTTIEFAARLEALREIGLEVEVLEEDQLEKLGMGALLGVGMGSAMPSKVVTMRWKGAEGAPLALIGKGVVFDTGGISLKPAQGMEDMTMDMGGAGTVSGVMKTLALRKAKAHVVGMVGLVENMPSHMAQRPGDIVTSMKGDTIEVINTDAEGRLVLADVMWHAQEAEKPAAMIDLATLTGACIVALGHENAGVFSNDDGLAGDFLKAAQAEGEGAWRLPLGQAYDDMLKSQKADIKNVGGRPAGAITAAQFLQRFVQEGTPWIHLDIAGVAQVSKDTDLSPKGATGWGVMALDRLVRNRFEG